MSKVPDNMFEFQQVKSEEDKENSVKLLYIPQLPHPNLFAVTGT